MEEDSGGTSRVDPSCLFPPSRGAESARSARGTNSHTCAQAEGTGCCQKVPPTEPQGQGCVAPHFSDTITVLDKKPEAQRREGAMIRDTEESMAGRTRQKPAYCLPAQGSLLPEHMRHQGLALSAPHEYWPPLLHPGQQQPRLYKAEIDREARQGRRLCPQRHDPRAGGLGEARGLCVLQAAIDGQGPSRQQAWLLRSQMRPTGEVEREATEVGAWAWALLAQTLCC